MEVDSKNLIPDIRYLNDMREVVYDKEWLKTAGNSELYYMYRGIEEKDGIRYDITIIPPVMLGAEFVKTKGHYHVQGHQEIYTVLDGETIYLMQKADSNHPENIEDVYAVKARKGDTIIIPRFYGHTTTNPSATKELKMANWVSTQCRSDYSLYEKMQGACYYYLAAADGGASWLKNKNYKNVPPLRFEKPLKSVPENLDFLKEK